MPIGIRLGGEGLRVDWADFSGIRFTAPFYVRTVAEALRAHEGARRETPVEFLEELAAASPGLRPSGFIFHPSRSGSTLVSQMLAALPRHIVISEPPPIDELLQREGGRRWLRALIQVWARPRHEGEDRFFLKFDGWHIRRLPEILEAFPDVPWIFVYRDPIEVIVSQQRLAGGQLLSGACQPWLFGLTPASILSGDFDEFVARALAQFYGAAVEFAGRGRGCLVNYRELPAAATGSIARHFGVEFTEQENEAMADAAKIDVKNPGNPFRGDSDEKQREADEKTIGLVREWLVEPYEKLEALRTRPGG